MFLEKYVSKENLELIIEEYESAYLESLEEKNFLEICSLFKKYNVYCIEDIIVNYLELFTEEKSKIETKLVNLIKQLGKNYSFIIGNDLRYIKKLIEE